MANVNSLTNSSSAASLYGNRNVISGLASGLDTESMIENSVSGYKEKVKQLNQEQAKVEWKQDAFREVIDQSIDLVNKYTSFSSSTNLMSSSFFNDASATTVSGQYASMVSASGTPKSSVEITKITQMATASTYSFSPGASWGSAANNSTESFDLSDHPQINKNAGVVTLAYGSGENAGSIKFEIGDFEKTSNASELQQLVHSKLKGLTVTNAKGETVQAAEYFQLSVEGGALSIKTKDYEKNGEGEWIDSSQTVTPTLTPSAANGNSGFDAAGGMDGASQTVAQYLGGKSITVTYNGLDQKITFPHEPEEPFNTLAEMANYIEEQINEAFSTAMNGEGGTTVTDEEGNTSVRYINVSASADGKLTFDFANTSGTNSLQITSDFNSVLGLGEKGLNTQVDVANTKLGSITDVDVSEPLTINGVTISTNLTADSTVRDVMNAINNNSGKTGVSVIYSNVSNQFVFTSTETGSAHDIQLGDGLAKQLFGGGTAAAGKDAIVTVKNNGVEQTLYRSSNTIDMDGLKVTLKGTFTAGANETGITFGTSSNSDKIVDAVKSFVEDFNKLSNTIRTAYATQPNRKSDGSSYQPLTDEDKNTMSEYAIKKYEETAKQGLLFGDSDLSSMYSKMIQQLIPGSDARQNMEKIGLTTSYKDGVTTLSLDESKLRASLSDGTETVKKVFNDSSYGANDSLAGRLKKTLDTYTSTSISKPGILVRKAGTKHSSSSLLNNALKEQINRIQEQVDKWEIKMSSKIDYYTRQFSKLEQLLNTMNNQSSMLSGMMGG